MRVAYFLGFPFTRRGKWHGKVGHHWGLGRGCPRLPPLGVRPPRPSLSVGCRSLSLPTGGKGSTTILRGERGENEQGADFGEAFDQTFVRLLGERGEKEREVDFTEAKE
jgi:hypothetical protein